MEFSFMGTVFFCDLGTGKGLFAEGLGTVSRFYSPWLCSFIDPFWLADLCLGRNTGCAYFDLTVIRGRSFFERMDLV